MVAASVTASQEQPPPKNGTLDHVWFNEPRTAQHNTQSLTDVGVTTIAEYQYTSGHSTYLDTVLNPVWTWLTELLPLWMAPNLVTLLGATCCFLSYGITWYYVPQFDDLADTELGGPPDWVIFLSGVCTIIYFTMDCMDGKQARRTQSSSPLGQLFDHGFDCLCNLSHISMQAAYLSLGGRTAPYWFLGFQGSLFFAFFLAQWEEYYTGVLPHACGNFGVTEVNYGLGLFAIVNSCLNRKDFWSTRIPFVQLELKYVGMGGWLLISLVLILACGYRVFTHPVVIEHQLQSSAVSKLITPFCITVWPFVLPYPVIQHELRSISILVGISMSYLTMKLICFSMAKQAYASIQRDAIPYWVLCVAIRCYYDPNAVGINAKLQEYYIKRLLQIFCVYYVYKLVSWAKSAIEQITHRLDIHCFTLKKKHPTNKTE